MPKYFLYRHIRLDNNMPFYIGVGKVRSYKPKAQHYERVKDKVKRNDIWNSIVAQTQFLAEVIFECDDVNLIEQKEQEFIALYGKIIDGTGSLANIYDGGFKCKRLPNRSRAKLGTPIYVFNCNGLLVSKFDTIREAQRALKIKSTSQLFKAIKDFDYVVKGYHFTKELKTVL